MKEKFIKSTIILVIGGFLTKVLGMVIRILMTRKLGTEGIGLYMLVLPTFNLFITIATLSLPVAIAKVVSEEKTRSKKIIFSIIPIAILFNILIILILLVFAPTISKVFLKNEDLYYPLIAIASTIPFITTSSVLRGYFFGKQKMIPHVTSNLIEQIIRIIAILIIVPKILKISIIAATTSLILINIISEFISIITLILFLPRKIKIKKEDLKADKTITKEILDISIPTTLGRLIGAIGNFLEPIILTFILFKLNYTSLEITNEYGILSGYVLPMVMMPSFLTGAISSALLPVIAKFYSEGKKLWVKQKVKQAIIISLLIGIPWTVLLTLFPEIFLNLIFNTTKGASYLKIAAPIFLISYIEGPLSCTLQAINESKTMMKISITGITIKMIFLFILTHLNIKMYSLLLSSLLAFTFITVAQIKKVKEKLK